MPLVCDPYVVVGGHLLRAVGALRVSLAVVDEVALALGLVRLVVAVRVVLARLALGRVLHRHAAHAAAVVVVLVSTEAKRSVFLSLRRRPASQKAPGGEMLDVKGYLPDSSAPASWSMKLRISRII